MKPFASNLVCSVLLIFAGLAMYAGCTSVPVDPTPRQQVVANAVEDTLAIGLVPVLTNNRSYIPAAAAVAAAVGSFSGDSIAPADVDAVLSRAGVTGDDAAVIAGMVNAAWDTYSLRYSQQVNGSVRPDVKLFLSSVANGIRRAIAAVPKLPPVAMHELKPGDQIRAGDGVNTMTYMGNGGWLTTLLAAVQKEPQYVPESSILK